VHQPLSRTNGPDVGLEDPEIALRGESVKTLGKGAHELRLHVAGRVWNRRRRQALASDRAPAGGEMVRDVRDQRSPNLKREVVPAEAAGVRMAAQVITIAVAISEVESPDECQLVVDDHELLVVAVDQMLAPIERDLHARAGPEVVTVTADVPAIR